MESLEGPEAAKAAGLRYTTDALPGIRRVKRGRNFLYFYPDGKQVTDTGELARIKSLGIPPAYANVWISPIPNGHLQATGYDARGRKQYRYHKRWNAVRGETKFHRMVEFARALPSLRARVVRDMRTPGMSRQKVIATVVSLLEITAIRVGNEEYARENESFGLTTLHEEHAQVKGTTIRFHFKGKSGKIHDVEVHDRRLAGIVKASQDLPGQHLFEYVDEHGVPRPIHSDDVNAYLQEITGDRFTAKDFRTWEATMTCALELAAITVKGAAAAKKAVVETIKHVSEKLRNTPAVCKRSYIHPGVIATFLQHGKLELAMKPTELADEHALSAHEHAVIALIEEIEEREKQPLGHLLAESVRAERRKAPKRMRSPAA